jgi:phage terminase large subunit
MLERDQHYEKSIEGFKYTNPNYYKIYVLGEWGQKVEGLIYPDFTTVAEMPPVQAYGLDFGYNDPCALVGIATEDQPDVKGENLYWEELLYESYLTSSLLIERMGKLGVDKTKVIVADSARPEMIADIKKAGFNIVPCVKYKGSVGEGINAVKTFHLKIVAGSKNLFKEITNYIWKEKDGKFLDDEPVDVINHLMDAGRYGTESFNHTSGVTIQSLRLR